MSYSPSPARLDATPATPPPHLHPLPTRRSSDLALGEGGGAQHAGAAELDQHAALGVVEPVTGDAHLAQLLGRATVGTVAPGRLGTAGGVAVGVHGTASGHQGWVRSSGQKDTSRIRSEEHTSELQSRGHLVCRLLLEKKKKNQKTCTLSTRARLKVAYCSMH